VTETILAVAGILLWAWLLWQIIKPGSLLDADYQRVCTGCQRYFIRPGCPVHDRRVA
jgi:hypothetical protein